MARPRRTSAASETSTLPDSQQELGNLYDYLVKIVLLGPSGAGKSCLLQRFVKNEWRVLSSQTIGVEFSSKIVKIGSGNRRKRIKLQLWDTAGTERFRSVSRSYYRGAAGAILVYDIASQTSFNSLPTFLTDARALASPQLTVILAGNKLDLSSGNKDDTINNLNEPPPTPTSTSSKQSALPGESGGSTRSRGGSINYGPKWTATTSFEGREVDSESASRWASKVGVPLTMEVSALSGDNVEELFTRLAGMILTKIELGEIDPDDPQSGIQYGDGGTWNGSNGKPGLGLEGNTVRSRGRKNRTVSTLLAGVSEWDEVFRFPGERKLRRCC